VQATTEIYIGPFGHVYLNGAILGREEELDLH